MRHGQRGAEAHQAARHTTRDNDHAAKVPQESRSGGLSADDAGRGRPDQSGVLGEDAASVARRQGIPAPLALVDGQVDAPLSMSSTILSPSRTNAIGPPSVSFGCDMADRGSGGAAGEPSVGHQQDIAAEARAFDRARDCEHLPHARAAPVSSNDLTRTYRQRTATNYVARQRSYGRCSARSHLSACTSRRNTQSARAVTRRTGGATSSHLAMTAGTPPLFSDVAGVISPT